jgi:hypothetical protein
MDRDLAAPATAAERSSPVRRGRMCRCRCCGGLHFQFGNLSARLDAESFLQLANRVHYAATVLGPELAGDQRVVIPFGPGRFSLLLDREELEDLHGFVQRGLKWLDEQGVPEAVLSVH